MLYKALLITSLILIYAQNAWAKLDIDSFQQKVSTFAKNLPGTLGVGVLDVQTGESWYLNGNEYFRMQSVVKVPVAIAMLHKVDEGKLQLQEEIPLTKHDIFVIRNAAIPDNIPLKSRAATLDSLIEQSICRSNNGAVDVLTKILGGPDAVTATLKEWQIPGIRIDRYEAEASQCKDKRNGSTLLDSTTPLGMCTLLYKLKSGKILSAKSTSYLIDLMRRCETGDHRIRAGFPKNWTIADKTGTGPQINGVNVAVNDVAIIASPDKSSRILTVFLGDTKLSLPTCENKIADIGRALYLSLR